MKRGTSIWLFALLVGLSVTKITAQSQFVTIDRFVPHTSTVPANEGDIVGLYLHEKLSTSVARDIRNGQPPSNVVLFIHGGSVPSVPNFDLPYKDYSWMEFLAEAGFDTFSIDHTGYGLSPRPLMDDPCNIQSEDQALVIPHVISEPCDSRYPHPLTTLDSDVAELNSVVDFIRDLRDIQRIHLIGWSAGGRRAAAYAATQSEKVEKLILLAPSIPDPDAEVQRATAPMRLQSREMLLHDRWQAGVICDKQVDPEIRDVIWQTILAFDSLGTDWGTPDGFMRVRTAMDPEWSTQYPAMITAETLIMVGEQDSLLPAGRALYANLINTDRKVLVEMACATHMAVWERTQYKFMHEASKVWLISGAMDGHQTGAIKIGPNSVTGHD